MAKRLAKIFIMLLLIALVSFVLVGCSPRGPIDSGVQGGGGSNSNATPINKSTANNYIKTATENRHKLTETDGTEEWFVIDLTVDFAYNEYTEAGALESSKFTLIFKANWNLIDNNKSELLIRLIDPSSLTNVLGLYYLDRTMYVNLMDGVAGYENMSYRFNEVNFSTIAQLLSPLLSQIGLDPLALIMSVCGANTTKELGGLLDRLGLDLSGLGIDLFGILDGIAQGLIFDTSKGMSTYELSPDGKTETVGVKLKVNDLLKLLKDLKPLLALIKIDGFSEISWTAFGLPNFDPILEQFLGFSLAKLQENDWPAMTAYIKGINTKQEVDKAEAFVLNGMEIDIKCDPTDEYGEGQYNVNIKISPFFLGAKKEKTAISFAGLDLTSDSTKFRDGGLLNLEAQLALIFEAPKDTTITVGDILGGTMDELLPGNDLSALKKLPISFLGSNGTDAAGNPVTRYEFDIQLKVDLDLFNGENNRAEINLMCANGAGGLKTFLSVYLVGTTLYVYTEGMDGATFTIPNISIPNLDLTALLFGEGGALGIIMPYLDPEYVAPDAAENVKNGAVKAPNNAPGDPIDVMALLKQLVTFKEYYDWRGNLIVNDEGNISLPGSDPTKPLTINLDNETINALFGNFLEYSELGIEHILIETFLTHPQNSTRIEIMLPKGIRAEIQVKDLGWLGRPTFDFSNVDNKQYTEVGGDADFYINLSGEFGLGIQKEDNAARVVLNLSDLIQNFAENILLDIGVKVSESAKTTISYELKANFSMKTVEALDKSAHLSFRDTSFALYLRANGMEKHFLMVYYNGTDDMLYIDFSNLEELQKAVPLFKIFKPRQPSVKIKLGLSDLLDNNPKPVLSLGVDAENGNINVTDFIMMALTGTPFVNTDNNAADGKPLDIVDLIGKLLEGIMVQDDTLSIIASNQILSVLLAVLDVKLGEGTMLPGTNIYGKLNVMNPDPDKGFLELHLGLVGEEGSGTEFLSLDVLLLNKVSIEGNKEDYEIVDKDFNSDNFINLYNLMETLTVSFEMGGKLKLDTNGKGFSLGDFLAKLLGAKYLDPYFDTVEISSELDFNLKANIDLSGLNIKESGELIFDATKLLNSEILLEIIDRAKGGDTQILGIYYKNQNLYLKLSYFGLSDICLTNAGDFILNLIKPATIPPAQRILHSAAGAVQFDVGTDPEKAPIRLGITAVLSPYGLSIALAEGALTNLVGGLLGLDEKERIEFGAVTVEVDIENGISLTLKASIETIELELSLGGLSIGAHPSDKINIVLPEPSGGKWVETDASSLLTSVKIRLEASIGIGGEGLIDLSPLITALLVDSDDPNASKIDINVFIKNLGLEGAELNAVVEAELNFQAILKSMFRVTLYTGEVGKSNVLLVAIFDGAANKLYIKTELFGLCNKKTEDFIELDITKLTGSFMKGAMEDAQKVETRKSPFASMFTKDRETPTGSDVDPLAQFIKIIFVEGGIELKVAQEALLFLFQALGIDASKFLESFKLEIDGKLSIMPVSIELHANLNDSSLTLDLALNNLSLAFGQKIDNQDLKDAKDAGRVKPIVGFTSIGIDIKGTISAEVSPGDDTSSGEIKFDKLIENILGAIQAPILGLDKNTLSTIGLLFKVLKGNSAYPMFGGTLYYSLGGAINVVNVENLYLTLKLGSVEGGSDVLDIIVRGSAKAGGSGVDIFVNAQQLLGIKPFVLRNVAGFISMFQNTGIRLQGVDAVTGKETPQFNRKGDVKNLFAALTGAKQGTDEAFANAIVLYLASNYQEMGLQAPIQLDVGAGALYGILQSVAGIDLAAYLEGHDVFARVTAGGDVLLGLDLGLENFVKMSAGINTPSIDLNPIVPDAPTSGYTELDDKFTTIRVALAGEISFKGNMAEVGPDDEFDKNVINIGNILGNFLTGVDLKVLMNLLTDVDKTMKYKIDVSVDLKKIIKGDWTAISGKIEFTDISDKVIIGVYYLDGNLFLDLTGFHMGKIRINNFAVFIAGMIGPSPSSAGKSALSELPSNSEESDNVVAHAAAAAYINILLGNDTGIVLEVTAEAIAIILSSIAITDPDTGEEKPINGQAIIDAFHGILELKLGIFEYNQEEGKLSIVGLSFKVATYEAALKLDSAQIILDNTDVRPPDYTAWQNDFAAVGELSEWIYVRTAFTFGWHLSEGMTVDFSDILGTFLKGTPLDVVSLAPVLKILSEFGQDFKLEVEAKVNFGNLMRDGTLLPDILGPNGVNIDILLNSEISIKLICTTGDKESEVLSLAFKGGNLYVDLSAFSIGRVVVQNAYPFFLSLFAPGNSPAALAYALPYSSKVEDNANKTAKQVGKEVAVLASFININVQSDAVALHIGTAGLFAILGLLDSNFNWGLTDGSGAITLNGLQDMINPLGDLDLALWLMTKNNLLQLAITLKEWIKNDQTGEIIEPGDREIALNFGLSSDFEIALGDDVVKGKEISIGLIEEYVNLTDDALIGVATRLEFHIDLEEGTVENIFKDPLQSLIGGLLTQIALNIGLQVMDEMHGTIALNVKAEIKLLSIISGISAGGFDLSGVTAEIGVEYNGKTYATLTLSRGDLFADLTLLGGPKAMIANIMGLIPAAASAAPKQSANAQGENRPLAAEGESGDESLLPKLPISIELLANGLFISIKKAAFNTIFTLINVNAKNLGDWEITDDIEVKLGLSGTDNPILGEDGKSFKLGAGISFEQGNSKILGFEIDLNGIGAQFKGFDIERPNSAEYSNIMEVDTILANTSLQFHLNVFDGQQVDLGKAIEGLFKALNVENPLKRPISPQIKTEALLAETIQLDLQVAINIKGFASGNINDILSGIKVKASLYSVGRPDFFKVDIYFDSSTAYIDATTIGLGKIKLPFESLLSQILKGTSPAALQSSKNIKAYGEMLNPQGAAAATPEAAARKALAVTYILFSKDGIVAIAAYDTLKTILSLVGVPLGDYLDGVIAPSIEIEITDRFGFNLIAHILTGDGSDPNNEILKLGLSLVGGSTNADVKVSTVHAIEGFEPPDPGSYISYDELTLLLSVNASISVAFLAGYIPLDDILDLLISNMKMGIDIKSAHAIAFSINGTVGIDLKKFLAKSPTAMFGELTLRYTITDENGTYDQTLAKVYIVEDGIYVQLKVQDIGLDLKVKVPDLNIPSLIWDLIDGKDPFAASANDSLQQVHGENTKTVSYEDPLAKLLAVKATGTEAKDNNALEILIGITSQELNVGISVELLATILPLLGLKIDKPKELVESVMSGGKVAIAFDPTFRIYIQLEKKSGGAPYEDKDGNLHERGGYLLEISLFHGTEISLDRHDYLKFASKFTDSYDNEGYSMTVQEQFDGKTFGVFSTEFLPFNLKKLISGDGFDIVEDFLSSLGGKVELELGVDFKKQEFNFNSLFQNEEDAFFIIKIADALKGSAKIVLEFDVSLRGLIKDAQLAVDALLNFEDQEGNVLLTLAIRGGGDGVSSPHGDGVYPSLYLYSEAMGIPKLKVNSPVLKSFINLDLNALLRSLGLGVSDEPKSVSAGANSADGNKGILDNSDEGLAIAIGNGTLNIADILDSISIQPGRLAIVLAKTIVKDLFAALLDFPFEDIYNISVEIADGLYLDVSLKEGFSLKMNLGTLEVDLGGRKIFGENKTEVDNFFRGYIPLSEYKWSFELESELTINDSLISLFSLGKMTSPFIGADVVLEAGEILNTKITFFLRGFIDFADLSKVSLQLAMVSDGKEYINIMYVGDSENPKNSMVYLDLTGLGFTALKLNLDLGGIIKNLLGGLVPSGESAAAQANEMVKAVSGAANDAMRPAGDTQDEEAGSGILYNGTKVNFGDEDSLEKYPFGASLLLLVMGSSEVSVAITGALLTSLMHGISEIPFEIPVIKHIRVGYIEGKMAGIELVLNEENFRIAYSFTEGSSSAMGKDVKNPINPKENSLGEPLIYGMSDIGLIQQIFLALKMEIRISTKKADGQKSDQLNGIESFIEKLIGVADGTVDFAPQNTSMIISFDLQLNLNLADLNRTQLALTISMGGAPSDLLGVYFDKGSVYADLSGLGLFKAKISGLDIITLILGLLKDVINLDGGLDLGGIIDGILPSSPNSADGKAPNAPAAAPGKAASAERNTLAASQGLAANPKIRVILTNDSLYIVPSMSAIGAVIEKITQKPLGFELPEIGEIRLGINLKDGLNNLFLNIKLDNYNNGVEISIPSDGGLAIKLNDDRQTIPMPTDFGGYGGIAGISLSNGGIDLSVLGLVSSLVDSIDAPVSLGLYIKKRNSYFNRTNMDSYFDRNGSVDPSKGPWKDPLNNDIYETGQLSKNTQTSAGIVVKRDVATNYLELTVALPSHNNNSVTIRWKESWLVLLFGSFNIKILGISINLGGLIGTFVKDGIKIAAIVLNSMVPTPPLLGETGSLSGTVKDENGAAVSGAQVTMQGAGASKNAKTDALGNYAFAGLAVGTYKVSFENGSGYYSVERGEYDILDMQKLDTAQTLDVTLIKKGSGSQVYTNVIVKGYVRNERGLPVANASVYIDNVFKANTNTDGSYTIFFETLIGSQHAVTIKAGGYNVSDGMVEMLLSGSSVAYDAKLIATVVDRGTIRGSIREAVLDENGNQVIDPESKEPKWKPVTGDFEIWLVKDGATLRNNLTPFNYLGTNSDGVRLGTVDSKGAFIIPNLEFGTYVVKIRSPKYENQNISEYITPQGGTKTITISGGEPSVLFKDPITVTCRKKEHFTENAVTNTTVAGIRIRLGADKLDGDNKSGDANDTISDVFETGNQEELDQVTYIEAWLGENLFAGLFDMLHGLISSGLGSLGAGAGINIGTGFANVAADKRIDALDLARTAGAYNEDDMSVYDFKFKGRAEYLQNQTAFLTKFPAALLQNILSGLLVSMVPALIDVANAPIIGPILKSVLGSTVADIGSIVGSIFPFAMPYNMAENKVLPGNPLEGYNNGFLTNSETRNTDGTTNVHKVTYGEKSVYARIKLSQLNEGGLLDSIKLFVNGAEYRNKDGYGNITNGNFALAKDMVEKTAFKTVENGVLVLNNDNNTKAKYPTNRDVVEEWLRKNTVNDYVVVEDFIVDSQGDSVLWNQSYIRNMETAHTQDEYFELDILNNGLYLKSAKPLNASLFCNLNADGSYSENITLPEKVIFNNPYDLSDFTVVGGSWAAQDGGIRTNTDRTKAPIEFKEIFPNRNKVSFPNGGSSGSSGAHVSWSLSLVNFNTKGGDYDIIGSCLNQDVKIKCTVKPRTIDPSNILELLSGKSGKQAVPDIDAYTFDEESYINSLPTSFREGSQEIVYESGTRVTQTGKYVFNELSWDMSDVTVDNVGGNYNIHLTYGFSGGAKGKVDVPVKVLDRNVHILPSGAWNISGAVNGSENGLENGVVTFDPYKLDREGAENALKAMSEVWLNTMTGAINVRIYGKNDIDFGAFSNVDFAKLDYSKPESLQYKIYINVKNKMGDATKIPVTVQILNKAVAGTSNNDLTEDDRTIHPFRKGGLYDKDTGLSLPTVVELRRKDGTVATIQKGIDYVWGMVVPEGNGTRVIYEGKDSHGIDNWKGRMSTDGGVYTFAMFSIDEEKREVELINRYRGSMYEIQIKVAAAKLTSTEEVVFYPYDNIRLPQNIHVGFNGGAVDKTAMVNVRWTLKDGDIYPSFTGKTYFSEVEIYDALFASETMLGAQVTVKQVLVTGFDFGEYAVNPYFATDEIAKLFRASSTKLIVDDNMSVTKDLFDIVDWKISSASLGAISVSVKVGNKGYASNPVWYQERVIKLKTIDMTKATILPIEIESVYDGMPKTVSIKKDGTIYPVPVDFLFDRVSSGENFYRTYQNVLPFVPQGLKNVTQNVTVLVKENNPTAITDQPKIVLNGDASGSSHSAYSNYQLPTSATLDFGGAKVRANVPVIWDSVEGYSASGGTAIFSGRVGKPEYGYIRITYTVNVTADAVGLTDLPELIQLDPLKDLAEQLKAYQKTVANITNGTATLDVTFPQDIPLIWQGTDALTYKIKVGKKLTLTSGTVFIYEEKEIKIQVFQRKANKIQEKLVGHVYKEIDFRSIKEVTVLFESGEILKSKVSYENWIGLDGIDYSRSAEYRVDLVVFADNDKLRQVIKDVDITVRSAILVAAYRSYENGVLSGKVNLNNDEAGSMKVDPYEGFRDLPGSLYGSFDGIAEPILMQTEWIVDHIVRDMSVKGGTFTNDKNNAGRVTLFIMKNGEKIRPQQLTFEVEIIESITEKVEFSTDAHANESSEYSSLNMVIDKDGLPVYNLAINPYDLTSYNESPLHEKFSYYRAIKVTLKSGKTLYFNLEQMKYNIYDKKTGVATITSNLYLGRNIMVKIAANEGNIKDANGKQVLAKDAVVYANIDVEIYDMSYDSCDQVPDDFTVDVYGAYFADTPSTTISLSRLRENIKNIEQEVIVYGKARDAQGNKISSKFKGMTVGQGRLNVNYKGEMGYIDFLYGNEFAGMQTVSVPVKYTKRELQTVIDTENTAHYYTVKDNNGKKDLYTMGQLDPNMKIDERYTKGLEEKGGFIFDPFESYKLEDFFGAKLKDPDKPEEGYLPAMSTQAMFLSEGGILQGVIASGVPVDWLFKKVYIDLNGGTFTVNATISVKDGNSSVDQVVSYLFRVLKRKVISATSIDDEKGAELKALLKPEVAKNGIKAYDYINAIDVDAAVGKACFVETEAAKEFTVHFTEGGSLKYTLGRDAAEHDNGGLKPEGKMRMNFRIDSIKPLNSKGNDVRFLMTIPGYGTGAAGQQTCALYVKSEKQEIVGVKTWLDSDLGGASQSLDQYFKSKYADPDCIQQIAGDMDTDKNKFEIKNPYYFINPQLNTLKENGLILPTAVAVSVRNEKGVITEYPVRGVNWQGTRANYFALSYLGGEYAPSFTMPVDNQRYSFKITVAPMVITASNGVLFDDTNLAGYGADEIILLPTRPSSGAGVSVIGLENNLATENYGYRIRFGNGETAAFNGVTGGGNARNSYNKWDFTAVNFNATVPQAVTMVLGGRGGQKVSWMINVTDKMWTGSSMQTVQLATVGDASFNFNQGDMAALGGGADGTLPTKFYQYFNKEQSPVAIPVTYGALLNDGLESTATENKTAFTLSNGKISINKSAVASAAPVLSESGGASEKTQSNVAAVKWTATTIRAYPEPTQERSGYLYFALSPKMSGVENKARKARLHNPDNDEHSYNALAPNMSGYDWIYPPQGLPSLAGEEESFYIDQFAAGVAVAQNEVPIIQVKKGTRFDVNCLPLFDLGNATYFLPWSAAKIYKHDKNLDIWFYDNTKIETSLVASVSPMGSRFNQQNGTYNVAESGGLKKIDTSKSQIRYTLMLNIPNSDPAKGNFLVIIAIDVVD